MSLTKSVTIIDRPNPNITCSDLSLSDNQKRTATRATGTAICTMGLQIALRKAVKISGS